MPAGPFRRGEHTFSSRREILEGSQKIEGRSEYRNEVNHEDHLRQ